LNNDYSERITRLKPMEIASVLFRMIIANHLIKGVVARTIYNLGTSP
jgi:hypothetical protein